MAFSFKPGTGYIMPAHFGQGQDLRVGHYLDLTAYTISYATNKDAVAALLPEALEPPDDALVSITYQKCRGVSFMAGGGYNLVTINVPCVFNGKKDHVPGAFALVLWENDTYPIILGRELLGAPKYYAEIPDPWIYEGGLSYYCAEYGTKLLEVNIKNLKPVADETLKQMNENGGKGKWLCWRYLPALDQNSEEVSFCTAVSSIPTVKQAWAGEGSHKFFETTFEQTPVAAYIMKGLNTLKVKEYRGAMVTHGSNDLLFADTVRLE